MKSEIYFLKVMHQRLKPKRHGFRYGIYMLYLDLDELSELDLRLSGFGLNRFDLFSFYDCDHLKGYMDSVPTRERVISYLKERGLSDVTSIKLLTFPRVLGYVFNPVSFYFAYMKDSCIACLVEVGNTFLEQKLYLVSELCEDGAFRLTAPKHFYVSPFGKLDEYFRFALPVPGKSIHLAIDSLDQDGTPVLVSTLSGECEDLSAQALLRGFFFYPLVTLKVIFLIHFNALILYLKRVPFFYKEQFPELQKGVFRLRGIHK